jgi:hypothetical protein
VALKVVCHCLQVAEQYPPLEQDSRHDAIPPISGTRTAAYLPS